MKVLICHYTFLAVGAALLASGGCASNGNRSSALGMNTPRPSSVSVDPRYTPEALIEAFAAVCNALRYQPLRVEVDQTEFPFIVYGVLEGHCDYQHIRNALFRMGGYAYAGCFTAIPARTSRFVPSQHGRNAHSQRPRGSIPEMASGR